MYVTQTVFMHITEVMAFESDYETDTESFESTLYRIRRRSKRLEKRVLEIYSQIHIPKYRREVSD